MPDRRVIVERWLWWAVFATKYTGTRESAHAAGMLARDAVGALWGSK